MTSLTPEAYAVIEGRHSDPFHYLGPHVEGDVPLVRVFLPDAEGVAIIDEQGHESDLRRIHDAGLFEGRLVNGSRRYRVRVRYGERQLELEDAYRFPPILSEIDLYLLGEGTHMHLYEKLGAHPITLDDVPGVAFAVFAPSAKRVSVVGDFNLWDGRRHAMRVRGNGLWEIFVPGIGAGEKYKYEIIGPDGRMLPLKSDPVAFTAELRPKTASIVVDTSTIKRPQPLPAGVNALGSPISIYEVHLGSWRRLAELPRPGRGAARLRARHGFHACRIPAGQRASIRRFLGISADRPFCTHEPVWHPRRFRGLGRCMSPRRLGRDSRLGARTFSG
jgi:1,4-alpha-glucan branching enzyme